RNRETAEWLKTNGVEVFFDPEDCTTHAKAVCADNQTLLVGSTNLSNSSVGRNNETNVLIRSPEIGAGFAEYFHLLIHDQPANQSWIDPTGTATLLADASYLEALHEMIRTASDSLDVIMYSCSFSDRRRNEVWGILEALAARAKDGVKVRLLFDQSRSFSRHITWGNLRAAAYLRQMGVETVSFDDPTRFTHAKAVVKDAREVLLGSTNWYFTDHGRNRQLNVLIRNPETARWFQEYIANKTTTDGQAPHESFRSE
ncbi:MAG TPA: phospholipase D-like domain-containing protein, partial [Candidatus Ozemobacteraceae bacterium]|nr:phospholipase D-like domain-containing protein [Candidatus Ozemobacteraceae bacterium]